MTILLTIAIAPAIIGTLVALSCHRPQPLDIVESLGGPRRKQPPDIQGLPPLYTNHQRDEQ